MLRLFANNRPLAILLGLIYLLLLQLFQFHIELPNSIWTQAGFVAQLIHETVTHWGGTQILSLVLILFQALWLNFTVNQHQINRTNSSLPIVAFALLMSSVPSLGQWNPLLLANSFVVLGVAALYQSFYSKQLGVAQVFNVGFWMACATLCYLPYGVLWFWGLIGLLILRPFSIQEILILLIGFAVPVSWVATWLYWQDKLGDWWQYDFVRMLTTWRVDIPQGNYLFLGVWALVLLLGLFSWSRFIQKTSVQVQKFILLLFWWVILVVPSLFLVETLYVEHILWLVFPCAILLSLLFSQIRSKILAEVFHLVILAFALSAILLRL